MKSLLQPTVYSYGCVMLYFNFNEIKNIHQYIDTTDIYVDTNSTTYGLEDEPHCTLLYGLHQSVSVSDVIDIVSQYEFTNYTLHTPSVFNTTQYDVFKFNVSGNGLHEVNASLKRLPHTTSFPIYNPHMTIGYLEAGSGAKYVDLLNKLKLDTWQVSASKIVYSTPSGKVHIIKLK
jgi:2'-5' RNA ligase